MRVCETPFRESVEPRVVSFCRPLVWSVSRLLGCLSGVLRISVSGGLCLSGGLWVSRWVVGVCEWRVVEVCEGPFGMSVRRRVSDVYEAPFGMSVSGGLKPTD